MIRCFSSHVQEQNATARRFLDDAVRHSHSFIPKTLLKLPSQDKTNVLCMTVCRWYQLIVPVRVCVNRSFGHFAARRGDTSAACRHVCYPLSELENFLQSACQKRQTLVGNDKRLSEKAKLCPKRQTLVGNDKKRLSETAKPCWKRQSFVGNLILS